MIILIALANFFAWSSSCKDYDKGLDILTPSLSSSIIETCTTDNCVKNQVVERDTCIDENTIIEYYCDHDMAESKDITCPKGTICLDGACRKK